MKRIGTFLVVTFFLSGSVWAAGDLSGYKVSSKFKVNDPKNPMEMISTSIIAGQRMRAEMENPILGPTILIQKGPSEPAYMLMTDKKTYYNVDEIPFKPSEEAMAADAKVSYKDTGKTKKIAGHSCSVRQRTMNGNIEEVCVTKDLKELFSAAVSMNAMQKQFGGNNPLKKLGGYPLEMLQYPADGSKEKPRTRMQVERIEKGTFAASLFEIPKGYTKQAPPGAGLEQMIEENMGAAGGSGGLPGSQQDMKGMMQKMKEALKQHQQK